MKARHEIQELRREIDQCDGQLRDVVRMRFQLVRQIVSRKVASGMHMHDAEREDWIVSQFKDIECSVERQLMASIYAHIFKSGKTLWHNAVGDTTSLDRMSEEIAREE